MIVTTGKNEFLRSLAPTFSYMAFGLGTTAAALADDSLQMEVVRVPVDFSYPDYLNSNIVVKATIPAEYALKVSEVGIFSRPAVSRSPLLTDFSEGSDVWGAATVSTSNVVVGSSTILVDPNASGSKSATGTGLSVDWENSESFGVSYFVGSNVSSMTLRFRTDASNYYSVNLPTTAGVNVATVAKSAFSTTGSPGSINEVYLTVNATAGGTAQVYFDALTFSDGSDQEGMLSRRVITPVTKVAGLVTNIEYSVAVTI